MTMSTNGGVNADKILEQMNKLKMDALKALRAERDGLRGQLRTVETKIAKLEGGSVSGSAGSSSGRGKRRTQTDLISGAEQIVDATKSKALRIDEIANQLGWSAGDAKAYVAKAKQKKLLKGTGATRSMVYKAVDDAKRKLASWQSGAN
jgi:hypothetical protein